MGAKKQARIRRPVASLTRRPAGIFLAVLCVLATLFCLAALKLGGAGAPLALIQPALPRLSHDGWRILDPSPPIVFEEEDTTPAPRQPAKSASKTASRRETPGESKAAPATTLPDNNGLPAVSGKIRPDALPPPNANEASPSVHQPGENGQPSEGELLLRETPDTDGQPKPQTTPPAPSPLPRTGSERGVLAIVVDDMGASLTAARRLLDLPYPVTFSILPGLAASTQTARMADASGRPPMLHQPMEPGAWPRLNPGPGGIYLLTPDEEIAGIIEKNLRQVPGVVGINNHMGSRLTRSSLKMAHVMNALKTHNLFFLDSMTAPDSVAGRESFRAGIPTYKRDVFLDNRLDAASIMAKLREAERLALAHGQAIAICHPHVETIEALERFGKSRDPRVEIRHISSLTPKRP